MILRRERVSERLAAAASYPIAVLAAPPGFGKSVALDEYVAAHGGDVLRFNVRNAHGSLPRFVRALAAAFEPELPRMGQSLAIAHERASQSPNPAEVLAAWLAEHLEGTPRTLVLDDFHHYGGNRFITAFVSRAIERTHADVRWLIATRSSADLPVATWLARGYADLPVDETVLRFSRDEAFRLGLQVAPGLADTIVEKLLAVTGGAPGVFAFGLQTIAQEPHSAERLLDGAGDPFARFADAVFDRFTPTDRRLLIDTAAFPEVDETLLARADGSSPWLAAVEHRGPQIFVYRDGRRQYHGLFLRSLRARLKELGSDASREASHRAASALERQGRIAETLAYHIRERRDAELVRIIDAHGFAFLEAGYGESILEAIDALDPLVQMSSPVVLAIKAMSESTIGRFDTAESWFQLALGRAPENVRAQIAYQHGNHLVRFFRREAVKVFEDLLADRQLSPKLRAYVSAALGPAYVFERRMTDARRSADDALAISKTLGAPHVTAKVHHQAAYVALYDGDATRAKELASVSLAYANERGYFDVAAGALSVLYNVASDIEDDPAESIRLLEAMGDCAAKSGSLLNQLTSLIGVLEIEIERGNDELAARIDEKLRTLDISLGGRRVYEGLLPTQALRATWTGDFSGAYRLLAGSADQQWSADRKALRYAEIAAYAAAAGLEHEASEAMRSALEVLAAHDGIDLRVQRALLYLALTATLLGRSEEAGDLLARVDGSSGRLSHRLRVLRRTLGALFERYRGGRNHNDVLAGLQELSACGFAGVARTLALLPFGDNAMRRLGRLTGAERLAAVRWADGDPAADGDQLGAIAAKLGCAGPRAVLRAVTWHRIAFERPRMAAVLTGGER